MAKTSMGSRRAERIRAFQALYGLHFTQIPSREELEQLFVGMPPSESEEEEENVGQATALGFAWELVEGVWSHTEHLDALIAQFSRNWRVERMGRIELTLLRLALFELAYRPDVPPKVAINEALDLTARFGDAKAKRFINGILDAAAKAAEAGTLTAAAPADSTRTD